MSQSHEEAAKSLAAMKPNEGMEVTLGPLWTRSLLSSMACCIAKEEFKDAQSAHPEQPLRCIRKLKS